MMKFLQSSPLQNDYNPRISSPLPPNTTPSNQQLHSNLNESHDCLTLNDDSGTECLNSSYASNSKNFTIDQHIKFASTPNLNQKKMNGDKGNRLIQNRQFLLANAAASDMINQERS